MRKICRSVNLETVTFEQAPHFAPLRHVFIWRATEVSVAATAYRGNGSPEAEEALEFL